MRFSFLFLTFTSTLLTACFLDKERAFSDLAGIGADLDVPIIEIHTANLSISTAELSDNALVKGGGQITLLANSATKAASCDSISSWGTGWGLGQSQVERLRTTYSPSKTMGLEQLKVVLDRWGNVTGGIFLEIHADDGSQDHLPVTSVLATSSNSIEASSVTAGAWYTDFRNFDFNPPVVLEGNSLYHFILRTDSSYDGTSSKTVRMMMAASCNNAFGLASYFFPEFDFWYVDYEAPIFEVHQSQFPMHAPTAVFAASATSSAEWDLSSFVVDENPSGETGSLRYDVGANNTGLPTYTIQNLSLCALRSTANISGRYLYIRAHFMSDGHESAALSAMSIDYWE